MTLVSRWFTKKGKYLGSILTKTCMCYVLSHFSHVQLFVTLWTIARQAPLFMGFSKQEYWSGLPCPPPRDLPNLGIEPMSLTFSALAGRFFTTCATWEDQNMHNYVLMRELQADTKCRTFCKITCPVLQKFITFPGYKRKGKKKKKKEKKKEKNF